MALRKRLATLLGRGSSSTAADDTSGHNHEYLDAKHDSAVASGVAGPSPVLGRGSVKDADRDFESDQQAPRRRTP